MQCEPLLLVWIFLLRQTINIANDYSRRACYDWRALLPTISINHHLLGLV